MIVHLARKRNYISDWPGISARLVAGHAHRRLGNAAAAEALITQARDLFAQIGVDPAVHTTMLLPASS